MTTKQAVILTHTGLTQPIALFVGSSDECDAWNTAFINQPIGGGNTVGSDLGTHDYATETVALSEPVQPGTKLTVLQGMYQPVP